MFNDLMLNLYATKRTFDHFMFDDINLDGKPEMILQTNLEELLFYDHTFHLVAEFKESGTYYPVSSGIDRKKQFIFSNGKRLLFSHIASVPYFGRNIRPFLGPAVIFLLGLFLGTALIRRPKKRIGQITLPQTHSTNNLTPRELEILQLIAQGLTTKGIAKKLFISPKTVDNHRQNIMNKMECHNVASLLNKANKMGFIDNNY